MIYDHISVARSVGRHPRAGRRVESGAVVGDGFQLLAEDGTDMTAQLRAFAAAVGLDHAASGRYSLLLLLQLWAGYVSGRQNPAKIVDELRALEAVEGHSCAFRPMTDTIPNRWRTAFRRHGGQCSDGMADTLAAGSERCPP